MLSVLLRYTHWLHTCWPAGTVEKLPVCDEHGRTNVPGVRIVGDLTGIPLLKFSADTAARAVREIAEERGNAERGNGSPRDRPPLVPDAATSAERGTARPETGPHLSRTPPPRRNAETLDLAIIGGGVAGISAAIEAKKAGLKFVVFEATEIFSTVVNFPKAKPIYTYPTEMKLEGGLQFTRGREGSAARGNGSAAARRRDRGHDRADRAHRTQWANVLTLHHSDGATTASAAGHRRDRAQRKFPQARRAR